MPSGNTSFKQRFILTGSFLALVILAFILYSYQLVSETSRENIENSQFSQSISLTMGRFTNTLQALEREIYEMAVLPDRQLHQAIQLHMKQLMFSSNELSKTLLSHHHQKEELVEEYSKFYSRFKDLGLQLNSQVYQLKPNVSEFCENALDVEKRFPGMPLLLNELLPRNNQFIEAADLAIIETKQSDRNPVLNKKILNLFSDARYYWSQQANWLRLFISNRYGVFGESQKSMQHSLQNRALYMGEVKKVLNKLRLAYENGDLELQQTLSYEEMTEILTEYEKYFAATRDVYLSEHWRNDLVIFANRVKPQLQQILQTVGELQQHLKDYNGYGISSSESAAQTVSNLVLYAGLLVIIVFIIGYFVFDKFIREPLTRLSIVFDHEARGDSDTSLVPSYVRETDILVAAFKNMQTQVHSRQVRLKSILDSAAEGIITVDEYGTIETFNIAAQKLFGYTDDILGKNLSILIPETARKRHEQYVHDVTSGNIVNILNQSREMEAVDAKGRRFPISIKISQMELEGRIFYTAVVENISQRKAMIENLQRLAEHDSLTGLYNRHYFTEEVDKIIKRYTRGDDIHIALLYIDLDNFKYVNDSMGHLAGDQLIVEAASLINSRTRESDILARLGGDEFAILLYKPELEQLEAIADSFRSLFETYTFMYDSKVVDIGCSIGCAVPDDRTESVEQLMARADFACHEAKRQGRNQVYVYKQADDDKINSISNDMGWAHRIRNALEHNRFVLALQPICDTIKQDECYNEVLLRMLDEQGEIIMPAGFLPAAERFGLMKQIDAWVVHNAIQYLQQQQEKGIPLKLSINLSASSVEDSMIPELIKESIIAARIPPQSIMLELTESVAMDNLNAASVRLRQLQELGCKTALDDFGIGYSSFAYLKDLPVDVVKIDGSFVKDINSNSLHKALVRSINDIAHEMGKLTVAEFVENELIVRELAELGVDYVQGYYLGKPQNISFDVSSPKLPVINKKTA